MQFGKTVSSIGIVLTILFLGCSRSSQTPPPMPSQPMYISHTVTHQGETLASIAKWYTGSSSNWQVIKEANPELDPRKIRIGTTIQIPRDIALRSDAPPKPKATAVAKKQTPPVTQDTAATSTTDSQDSFATNTNTLEGTAPAAQVASDLPQPPSEYAEGRTVETESTPSDSTLANETTQPILNEESSYDRASPGLPIEEQAIPNDISTSLPANEAPAIEGDPTNQAPKNGLVKGILEAVGNAALDSKKGDASTAPTN